MANAPPTYRSITTVLDSQRQLEGGGFPVRRPFPTSRIGQIDPFLLLDEMGPVDWPANSAIGAPSHPHRGFETVTYLLAGRVEHKDSKGNAALLEPGDVQWMTAGSGVVHSEMPESGFRQTGGHMHGFQIWVNLPAAHKMTSPRYQDIRGAEIPVGEANGVRVKVIAGESLGESALIDTHIPITYLHVTFQPGAELVQPLPRSNTAFAYVFDGAVTAVDASGEAHPVSDGQTAIFEPDGDDVYLRCPPTAKQPAQLLLLGGHPIGEPVARYGPFVMNTKQEIMQAIRDFQAGRFYD